MFSVPSANGPQHHTIATSAYFNNLLYTDCLGSDFLSNLELLAVGVKVSADFHKLAELGVHLHDVSVLELDLDLVLAVAGLGQNLGHNLGATGLCGQGDGCQKSSGSVCWVSMD